MGKVRLLYACFCILYVCRTLLDTWTSCMLYACLTYLKTTYYCEALRTLGVLLYAPLFFVCGCCRVQYMHT